MDSSIQHSAAYLFSIKMVGKDTELSKDEETVEIMLFMMIIIIVKTQDLCVSGQTYVFAGQGTLIL